MQHSNLALTYTKLCTVLPSLGWLPYPQCPPWAVVIPAHAPSFLDHGAAATNGAMPAPGRPSWRAPLVAARRSSDRRGSLRPLCGLTLAFIVMPTDVAVHSSGRGGWKLWDNRPRCGRRTLHAKDPRIFRFLLRRLAPIRDIRSERCILGIMCHEPGIKPRFSLHEINKIRPKCGHRRRSSDNDPVSICRRDFANE
jgi:hypothetical protein